MIRRLIYSLLYFIAAIILLPFEYKKRRGEFRHRWLREKFGDIKLASGQTGKLSSKETSDLQTCALADLRTPGLVWLHAVSVGEAATAMPLLYRLREKFPSVSLLVSTITDTGQRIAHERSPKGTRVIYLPFDLGFILKKALRTIRPSLFITMETEIWPNVFRIFKDNRIPVMMLNGRISDNSFKGYKRLRFFIRDILCCVDFFGMQDEIYAERIKELGAPTEKVKVLGNLKFDTKPSGNIPEWAKSIPHPVIIAGSTHRGEEELILSAYSELKKDFPGLNLIIAPRHPERFGEVEELVKSKGLLYIKRSGLADLQTSALADFRTSGLIVILDAMGELSSVYGACDIAIIGGSFIEHGGQNLLEPAFWSKPIICGPHMENFPFAKEFYEKNGAIETVGSELAGKLKELLQSPGERDFLGKMARELYDEKSGAVERTIKEIERFLKNGNL